MAAYKETVECSCGERLEVPKNLRLPWHNAAGTEKVCPFSGQECDYYPAIDPSRPKRQNIKLGNLTLACPDCRDGTGITNTPEGSADPLVCSYCNKTGSLDRFIVPEPKPAPKPAPRPRPKPAPKPAPRPAPRPALGTSRFDERKQVASVDERAEQFVASGLLSTEEYTAISALAKRYAEEAFTNRARRQSIVPHRYQYDPMLDTFKAYIDRLIPLARTMARNADAGEDLSAAVYFDTLERLAERAEIKFRREDMAELGL